MKLQRISFHLHWITLCCFLLPFFYDSCSKKPEEVAGNSSREFSIDTSEENYAAFDSAHAIAADTTKAMVDQRDKTLSETLTEKYPVSKLVLMPAPGTYTGFACITNTIPLLVLYSISISFLLLLIGLLGKLIDKNAVKIFLLLEVFALLFLSITSPPFFTFDTLWGYWICVAYISILTIIDTYIICKNKMHTV